MKNRFEENGWGLWALELRETGEFIGFTGLQRPPFEAHFTPCVEIGWRLAHAQWGDEIVAMTATTNRNSMRVMEKIGMTRDPADDFDIPVLPEGHRLRRHVLYRLKGLPAPAG